MSGLHAAKIDCLLGRTLCDQSLYLGPGARAAHSTRLPVRWLGVFARNELPDLTKEIRPFALVLNTDPRSKPGQHWLAHFGPKDGPIELFDLFGLSSYYYRLEYLRRTHSLIQLQSLFSAFCGHYCIYFLYMRSHKRSLFNKHTLYNIVQMLMRLPVPDNYIKNFIDNLQRTYRIIYPCNRTGQCCKLKCSFC